MRKLLILSIVFINILNITAQCDLPPAEEPVNTGANMTVMLTPGFFSGLNFQNETSYIIAFAGDLIVGYQDLSAGTQQAFPIWGDDSLTPELDGALSGETISFQLVDGSSLYDVEFATPVYYTTSSISFQTSAPSSMTLVCSENVDDSGGDCEVPPPFYGNTGWNMTVMLLPSFVSGLPVSNSEAYLVAITPSGIVVGSASVDGTNQTSIAIWGDDTLTPETDGALSDEEISYQLVDGIDVYDVIPVFGMGSSSFVTNGLATIVGSTSTLNCISDYIYGCIDQNAINFDENATSQLFYQNYNSTNNYSSCIYNSCQNVQESGCIYSGAFEVFNDDNFNCTNIPFNNGVLCLITGCTDESALNYNANATEDNGSCEYDTTVGDCVLPPAEAPLNTGDNMTVMLTPDFVSGLNIQNETAYIIAFDGDLIVGYQDLSAGTQQALAIWGDNGTTPDQDGALTGASISFQLVDGSDLYDLEFATPVTYTSSGLSVQTSAPSSITLVDCSLYGCTSDWADNYDELATEDDGSCYRLGCTDLTACNYDSLATQEDASCTYPGCIDNTYIEYYNQGYIAGCDDGSCSIDVEDLGLVVENFQEPMVTGSSMTVGFNISNINGIEEGTVAAFYDLNGDGIINTDSYMASNGLYYSECIGSTEFTPNEFFSLGLWGDDSSTDEIEGLQNGQSDVIFAILTQDNQVIAFNMDPEFTSYTTNGIFVVNEMNLDVTIYGCMNSDYCNYNSDAEEDDGSCEGIPGCMDISYLEYDSTSGCNNQAMCVVTWQQAYNFSQDTISMVNALNNSLEDSLEQEQINHLNTQIDLDSLQSQLAQCNEYLDYWSSPIVIDLLTGWNIIGYTFPEPQDIVATVEEIDDIILIIKNNNSEVYWPEFGFNGIGDFIPGQGYQIKVTEGYLGFTYPDVSGQRIELTPTVPSWAIDMEVEIHPNDIRTLVRVVNMLGQEVDPEMEPKGSVLLYLYNDATVEKKLVE